VKRTTSFLLAFFLFTSFTSLQGGRVAAQATPETRIPFSVEVRTASLDPRVSRDDLCVGLNDDGTPVWLEITGDLGETRVQDRHSLLGHAYELDGNQFCSAFVAGDLNVQNSYEFRIPRVGSETGFVFDVSQDELLAGTVLLTLDVTAVPASPYAGQVRPYLPEATSALYYWLHRMWEPGDELGEIQPMIFAEYGFAEAAAAERAFPYLVDREISHLSSWLLPEDSGFEPIDIGTPGDQRAAFFDEDEYHWARILVYVRYQDRILTVFYETTNPDLAVFVQDYLEEYVNNHNETSTSLLPDEQDVPEGWVLDGRAISRLDLVHREPPVIPTGTPAGS
jgi:hypothetical protein